MLQYFLQRHYVLHNRYTVFRERSMGKTGEYKMHIVEPNGDNCIYHPSKIGVRKK